jgi:hypothetical protein
MRVAAASSLLMFVVACGGQAPDAGRDGDGGGAGAGTGGYAILTAGDETWSYDTVDCEIDSERDVTFFIQGYNDADNVMAEVERVPGGEVHYLGLYSHSQSTDLLSMGFATPRDFLRVDGKSVRAEVELIDARPGANNAPVMVTFEGACP